MAIKYGFFNSVAGDRKYNTEDIGRYLHGIVSSGVYADSSTSLQVLAAGGMEVQVQVGRAMLDYHYMENDAVLGFTLSPGDTQDRIDAIVARLDMTNRLCEIAVKKGTPAAAPKRPAVERTDTIKEYMLASVYVARLATAITQGNITDTRPDTTVCGWVTGIIEQVPTGTLFAQWQTAYEEAYAELGDYLAAQQAAWETFFASVTDDMGLPAPALDDAGKVPTVNPAGNGYMLQTPDTTLTVPGAVADAAETGRRIKQATNVCSLLDNGDFKVNQRGATSYSGIGYGIDRWMSTSGYGVVTVNSDGLNLKSSNGTSVAYLVQFIEAGKIISGKKYTAACRLKNGTVHCVTAEASADMTEATKYIYVDGAQLGTIRFKYDSGKALYAVLLSTQSTSGMDIVNVALYEGEYTAETLPPYAPKGFGAELLECMRYYYRSNSNFDRTTFILRQAQGTWHMGNIEFPIPMRIMPTINIYSTAGNSGKVRKYAESTEADVGVHYQTDRGFHVNGRGNLTVGTWYEFHYEASADL